MNVRAAGAADKPWVEGFLAGWREIARRGELVRPTDHPMLIAEEGGERVGLLTYVIEGAACEILTLRAARTWAGTGTSLVEAVRELARQQGCRRLWVVTTNDNIDALRFYQRRGFRLDVLRPGAVDVARRTLKPEIPEVGDHGIPLRDEIELVSDL